MLENEIIRKILEIEGEQARRKAADPLAAYNAGRKKHKKQIAFHKCRKRNRWVFGGNRSGKTECGAVECVYMARGVHPYRKNRREVFGWVVSLTQRVQRDVAQKKILHYLAPEWIEDIVMLSGKKGSDAGIVDQIRVKNVFGGISVNAKDGSIISVYAGEDYLTKQLNQATQSVYEIGSTMKPMALLGAIQEGVNLDTVFNGNSPRKFDGIADPVGNFGNMSYGNVNLYTATAQSLNTVYMDVQAKLGTQRIAEIAKEAGAESDALDGTNPFTVLGNNALTTKDVARMYVTIANQGNRPNIHIVSSVKNTDGEDIYKAPTETTQVFDANDTALVTKAMTGTVQNGTATEALAVGHNLAMKTGTANDSYAASAVGFTPSVVSVFAMWYPDANGNPQEVPAFGGWSGGSDYPVHLFTQYMTQALAGTDNETFPNAVDHGKVGGPDGSWGLGSQTLQQMQGAQRKAEEEAQRQAEEEAQRQAEEEAQRQAEEEARRQQEQAEQERLEYCQNNPNDVSCGGSGNTSGNEGAGEESGDGSEVEGGETDDDSEQS